MRAAVALAGSAAAAALYLALRRRRKTDDARITNVLDFWFKGAARGRTLWFARGADRDAADVLVRDRFADVVEETLSGKLDHWRRTPRGSIALIIVLDQLARHVHRGVASQFRQTGWASAAVQQSERRRLALSHERDIPCFPR